jgi:hypothetical protein
MPPETENNSENTPDPSIEAQTLDTTPRNKGGRPKGSRNKGGRPPESGILNKKRRQYQYSLMERVRELIDPDLLIEYNTMILEGKTPIWERVGDGGWKVVPDPSPLSPTPTLADRNAAIKWLTERGHGLAVQSITVDAEYRTKVEMQLTGLSTELLESFTPQKLAALRDLFQLPSSDDVATQHEDIVDAELVDTTTNSPLLGDSSEH